MGDSPQSPANKDRSFFEVRWEVFEKIELLRTEHDSEHLHRIQQKYSRL